jgi:ABC-type amino acid transport system permease subunit
LDTFTTTYDGSFHDGAATARRAHKEMLRGAPPLGSWHWLMLIVAGVVAGIAAGALAHYFRAIPFLVFFFVLFVLFGALGARAVPSSSRSRLDWLDSKYAGRMTFTADLSGVTWQGERSGHWITWQGLGKMMFLKGNLLFLAGGIALVLPHRAFESDEAMKSFVRLALERMTPPARAASLQDRSMRRLIADESA